MAMLKLCRCGKTINIGDGLCPDCQAKQDKDTKARHKEYKRNRTDKDAQQFYNSRAWINTRNRIKVRDNGICKLCYSNNRIKFMDTVHHIMALEECKGLALVESNLISLCEHCHQLVHKAYLSSNGDKAQMQLKLRKILEG